MSIKSIEVRNLLSFDNLYIDKFEDVNCIIGQNNVGKSNLLKILRFFYSKLDGGRELPPTLHSKYSSFGSIKVTYNTTRIRSIVTSKRAKTTFQKHIYNTLFRENAVDFLQFFNPIISKDSEHSLTLFIHSNEAVTWKDDDESIRTIINHLYPFFAIETRHIDLYDWDKLWFLISKLKSFNVDELDQKKVIEFFDMNISENSNSYSDYINKIQSITRTSNYSYREKVLNYVKVGLRGQTFMIDGNKLDSQSDGTNSHKYLQIFLNLLISLTRREYISPTVYIDEPETGLHPKRNEELIYDLFNVYNSFVKTKEDREVGRYKTPYPNILISTHSQNIVKYIIRLFGENQQILHFSKIAKSTSVRRVNTKYEDSRFLHIFSDNESRLFFSHFILFVEGATEVEVFGNLNLWNIFPKLRNVDVYQINEVTRQYITPHYSNAATPYLNLYDADMLIDYNTKSKKIQFLDGKVNLRKIKSKYSKSFYGTEKHKKSESIKSVIRLESKKLELTNSKLRFTNFKVKDLIFPLNKKVFVDEGFYFTSSTFEGVLISEQSISIFEKWLEYEVNNNLNIKNAENAHHIIAAKNRELLSGNRTICQIANSLLSECKLKIELTFQQNTFIERVKREYILYLKLKMTSIADDSLDRVNIYRLLFDGKSDTLIDRSPNSFSELDQDFRSEFRDLRLNVFSPLSHLLGKTTGWTTRFLDYSIDNIQKTYQKEDFDREFSNIFPELYDIIQIASSSIDLGTQS